MILTGRPSLAIGSLLPALAGSSGSCCLSGVRWPAEVQARANGLPACSNPIKAWKKLEQQRIIWCLSRDGQVLDDHGRAQRSRSSCDSSGVGVSKMVCPLYGTSSGCLLKHTTPSIIVRYGFQQAVTATPDDVILIIVSTASRRDSSKDDNFVRQCGAAKSLKRVRVSRSPAVIAHKATFTYRRTDIADHDLGGLSASA